MIGFILLPLIVVSSNIQSGKGRGNVSPFQIFIIPEIADGSSYGARGIAFPYGFLQLAGDPYSGGVGTFLYFDADGKTHSDVSWWYRLLDSVKGRIDDFLKPDRVVIGAEDPRATDLMTELYSPFTRTGAPIMVMDCASAEMCKYAANALLACRISFMNEVATVCEMFGADVDQVRRAIGADRRIGPSFLFPGVGYGGSCFPKDVKALLRFSQEKGYDFKILCATEQVNAAQKGRIVSRIEAHFGGLKGKTIAVWGLAFKPRTDDMREAPSIAIVEGLLARGAELMVHDPEAMGEARDYFGDRVGYHRMNYDALDGADALLIVTEWNEFRRPDFPRMKRLLRRPIIFDGRNLYDPEAMREHGFTYYPIGRATVRAA